MKNIRLKEIKNLEEAEEELLKIGCDKYGIGLMAPKAIHRIIKIEDLEVRTANVLKQEMLSIGGECAVAKGTIAFKNRTTDALLMGTLKQYNGVISKLKEQPFKLKELAEKLKYLLESKPKTMKIGNRKFKFGTRTYIMGIINITSDSFSGDGILDVDGAIDRALEMESQGADIIDIGGESSRPYAKPVSLEKELERVVPVVKKLVNRTNIPISIDTYKSKVAAKTLELGIDMVNDISALRMDKKMPSVVAKHKVPIVLMHMKGVPRTMQIEPFYEDVSSEIYSFLQERIEFAVRNKIKKENIIVDPGIGFGKTLDHNLEIIRKLKEFKSLNCPILIGPSRKSFIGKILESPVGQRLEGTLGAVSACIVNGADIVRVHDVKECVRAARVMDAIVR